MIDLEQFVRTESDRGVASDLQWIARRPSAVVLLARAAREIRRLERTRRRNRWIAAASIFATVCAFFGFVACWSPASFVARDEPAPSITELEIAFRSKDPEKIRSTAARVLERVRPSLESRLDWAEDHYIDRCNWVVGMAAMAGSVSSIEASVFLRRALSLRATRGTRRTAAMLWQRIDPLCMSDPGKAREITEALKGED